MLETPPSEMALFILVSVPVIVISNRFRIEMANL